MISISLVVILVVNLSQCRRRGITPYSMSDEVVLDEAKFGDAEHRGPSWYEYKSNGDTEDMNSSRVSSSSIDSSSRKGTDSKGGSSKETKEEKKANRTYRMCTPCPHDMLKKYTNLGIKWICAGYQRARRTFKSECMMRFRNCQDGTLFVKLSDRRCKNDSYYGRHWFYIYQV